MFSELREASEEEELVILLVENLIKNNRLDAIFNIGKTAVITKDHLKLQILQLLNQNKGRLNTLHFHENLGIDVLHINSAIELLVKENDSVYFLGSLGDVITIDYINTIAEEINVIISTVGLLTLSEISLKYKLPMDFVQFFLNEKVGTKIIARYNNFDKGTLYSEKFLNNVGCHLAEKLSAVEKPVLLTHYQDNSLHWEVFSGIVDTIIKSGKVFGKVKGSLFIPHTFIAKQHKIVEESICSTGILKYSTLLDAGVENPVEFLNMHYDGTIHLNSCALLKKDTLNNLDVEISNVLENKNYLDLSSFFCKNLNAEDIKILSSLVFKSGFLVFERNQLFKNQYVVKERFLEELIIYLNEKFILEKEENIKPFILQNYTDFLKIKKNSKREEADIIKLSSNEIAKFLKVNYTVENSIIFDVISPYLLTNLNKSFQNHMKLVLLNIKDSVIAKFMALLFDKFLTSFCRVVLFTNGIENILDSITRANLYEYLVESFGAEMQNLFKAAYVLKYFENIFVSIATCTNINSVIEKSSICFSEVSPVSENFYKDICLIKNGKSEEFISRIIYLIKKLFVTEFQNLSKYDFIKALMMEMTDIKITLQNNIDAVEEPSLIFHNLISLLFVEFHLNQVNNTEDIEKKLILTDNFEIIEKRKTFLTPFSCLHFNGKNLPQVLRFSFIKDNSILYSSLKEILRKIKDGLKYPDGIQSDLTKNSILAVKRLA
ncbi:hypothetical protein HK099_002153 [Clydaea vesicula]|uniref:E3 UFM1-protein ligase 1-like N-terminal domain-containing protein n=1 Tax=Clydaea vesicula TaxID=447962 RepID=A0AAD5Y1L7_9FUNG|nr:hypothetical protein HK099_002153 [Clydaea vesicula]